MKRSEPPKRKTPLARSTKPIKRSPIKRSSGQKARREEDAWAACKAAVIERSHGYCEAWDAISPRWGSASDAAFDAWSRGGCSSYRHEAADPHHVWPEDRDRGIHDPARVLALCRRSHDWAHDHPAHASALGLLRPEPLG